MLAQTTPLERDVFRHPEERFSFGSRPKFSSLIRLLHTYAQVDLLFCAKALIGTDIDGEREHAADIVRIIDNERPDGDGEDFAAPLTSTDQEAGADDRLTQPTRHDDDLHTSLRSAPSAPSPSSELQLAGIPPTQNDPDQSPTKHTETRL